MEPQVKTRLSAGDFFLNLGATVSLYVTISSLLRVLFVAIDSKFPKITNAYYSYSPSISWPVAVLVIFFPIFIALMWVLGKQFESNPEKRSGGIHKWLTFLTLFITGGVLAGDLVAVLYYFIDGREITTAFLLKVLVLLVVTGSVFMYYINDVRGKLTVENRKMWRIYALVIVLVSIVWGFSVLGSPHTQRMYKYDQQKVNDLQILVGNIEAYYATNSKLPADLPTLSSQYFGAEYIDEQTNQSYEYIKKTNLEYSVCAVFNKSSTDAVNSQVYPYYAAQNWNHPAGRYCFEQKINTLMYPKPMPAV